METRAVDGRVAALPQSDAEAETLMELAEALRDSEALTAWTTCDGAGYGLDVDVTEGVMVVAAQDPTPGPAEPSLLVRLGLAVVAGLLTIGIGRYVLL